MTTKKQIRVAHLYRVSTPDQNLARQKEELTEFSNKFGWKIIAQIEEIGSGARKNKDRVAIIELLRLAQERKIDKVLVHEISRLGRSTGESLTLIDKLTDLGVSVYEKQRNIETLNADGTPNGISELILGVLASLYKMERSEMISRIRSGMQSAKRNGIHCGRKRESFETKEKFLAKYPQLIKSFVKGENLSMRKRASLYCVSLGTVCKIKILLESR